MLRLATSMEASGGELNVLLIGLLILAFVGIGTTIAAGGTAFSALIADRTTEAERPRVLSVVWGMRLLGGDAGKCSGESGVRQCRCG